MKRSRMYKKFISILVVALVLIPAANVWADYLGPNRTVTSTTTSWERHACYWEASHPDVPDGTRCYLKLYVAPESGCGVTPAETWFSVAGCIQAWHGNYSCPPSSGHCTVGWFNSWTEPCSEGQIGCTAVSHSSTVTYSPATVSAVVNCAQYGQNGWCLDAGSLLLVASEPVSSDSITYIEGTHNEFPLFCLGDSCVRALSEGENNFTYWAHSTFGDTSLLETSSVRVDTRPPVISGGLTGIPGNGDWFVSAVVFEGVASDPNPGSGMESFKYSLDDGTWTAYSSPLTITSGSHTIDLRAKDMAGNLATYSTAFNVDALPPVSSFTTSLPATGWVHGDLGLAGTSSDTQSGVSLVELSWDGGNNWQPLTGTTTWSYDWDTSDVADGTYLLLAHAQDDAGNWENTASLTVNLDNTPPEVELNAPNSSCPSCEGVTLVYSVTDATSGVDSWVLLLDGSKVLASGSGAGTGPIAWQGSSLPLGIHQLTLQAQDLAGNVAELNVDIDLIRKPVSDDPTLTNTPRPTRTSTLSPTKTRTPTITRTPTTTVQRIITFPTVTLLPTPFGGPNGSWSAYQAEETASARLTVLGKATIGIFIAAVLALGGSYAVSKMLQNRSWAFEAELAAHGMGDAFWLPTPPGFEIMQGPPELEQGSQYRTNNTIAQAINVQALLSLDFPDNNFSTNDYDLCGLIAVAALLGKSLKDVLCSFIINNTAGADILTVPRGTTASDLTPIYESFGWQTEIKYAGNWQTSDPYYYGAPTWQEIANLLNTGHGINALVRLNTDIPGNNLATLSKIGIPGVNHWVNVLEIIKGDAGIFVRIYNPYLNREETLLWKDFLNAWNNVPPPKDSHYGNLPYYKAIVSKPIVNPPRKFLLPFRELLAPVSIRGRHIAR